LHPSVFSSLAGVIFKIAVRLIPPSVNDGATFSAAANESLLYLIDYK
jgi:hypothetical protein